MHSFNTRLARTLLRCLISLAIPLGYTFSAQAESVHDEPHLTARIVVDRESITDGSFNAGIQFTLEDGWHIYAKEPGEVGLPTLAEWASSLPLDIGETTYPPARQIETEGLKSNIFEGSALLHSPIRLTDSRIMNGELSAKVSWVLCKDECIRSRANLSISVKDGVFPNASVAPAAFPASGPPSTPEADISVGSTSSLPLILLSAFIGGLLLNLMPCVFPVLSLKVLSLVEHAGSRDSRLHSLLFVAGVMISFLSLGVALVTLRSLGLQTGWGFQFQSPVFVSVMTLVVVAIGLNLSGVFEFGLSVQAKAGIIRTGSGYWGSFANGVLATVLATPCTAPFMGSAIAASLALPLSASLAIFIALGAGMSAPYIVLAIAPALGRFLPRPGAWMETFKQALAFPMYATAVWLVYVLATLGGPSLVASCGFSLVLLSLALWILGTWGAIHCAARSRTWSRITSSLLIGAALYLAIPGSMSELQATTSTDVRPGNTGTWEKFSKAKVNELISKQENFIIDFTAAWCLVCQVNESRIFTSKEFLRLAKERKVTLLKADWTAKDAEISEALSNYGRNSVPLVVVYTRGARPKNFEALIQPSMLLATLQEM